MVQSKHFSVKGRDYVIFSDGTIETTFKAPSWRNYKTVKLKGSVNYKSKYISINLGPNLDVTAKYLHRLVAEYFIPNPENKPYVNHKDGNKANNHVDNLEWCTYSDNHKHAYTVLKRKTNIGMNLGGGVHYRKDRKKWVARGWNNGKPTHLGHFLTESEARIAVDNFNKTIGK